MSVSNVYSWQKSQDAKRKKTVIRQQFQNLSKTIANLDLKNESRIKIDTYEFFKDLWNKGLIKGHSLDLVLLVSLYVVCRKNFEPIIFDEILQEANVSKNSATKFYRKLIKNKIIEVSSLSYVRFLDKILMNLKQDEYVKHSVDFNEIKEKTIDLLNKVQLLKITHGRHPSSVVAACIYIASDKSITQISIAYAAGVTEVTLRNNYQYIMEHWDQLSLAQG